MKQLLSGNEAIALGAYHGGVSVAAAYPGTPSTEILETIARYTELHAEWAPNEKVAMEVALGASYAGVRTICSMKHVGLNVAADPFFGAAITGVVGGLVVVTADDPGMHSSQNEQDNRHYARFAKVPVLEPSDSQEAYEMTRLAFVLSEQFDTPVLLRTTTRTSHSKSVVEYDETTMPERRGASFVRQPEKFVMIPAHARRRHPLVEERIAKLEEYAEGFAYNRVEMADASLGIISAGVAYQYARDVMPNASFLKLGMSYPLPARMILEFASRVRRLMVVEELDPFIEETVRGLGVQVEGKQFFPAVGELSVERVEEGFSAAGAVPAGEEMVPASSEPGADKEEPLPLRPPVLCPGCPHTGTFFTLKRLGFYRGTVDAGATSQGQLLGRVKRTGLVVSGDIGCYTLAVLPPLLALDATTCMGASIGMAMGMERAGLANKVVAVIGDSTFLHSGITPLLDVVYNGGTITTIILDNSTTAMTGHQENPSTGFSAKGKPAPAADLEKIVRGLGVEDVKVVNAFDLDAISSAVKDSVDRDEPSVVIVRGDCAVKVRGVGALSVVDAEACNGCSTCLRLGCPAIARVEDKARIDPTLCVGSRCGLCRRVCPINAIKEQVSNG
ncbi:MAG TPA: indolepyruvate ferredoxin oxidoreductase subunit alpha [Chloroflexota bacterium]|nr:indolepyruvate ferredoxin oxidoreductase subunit alpha [Chloroflexota bacterium]